MRNSYGRTGTLVRAGACLLIMLGTASPAAAQFGGLKKKLKAAAGQEAAAEGTKAAGGSGAAAANATAPGGGGGGRGGSVVLTPEVVDQMLAGLKAEEAYRQNARKEDTPYGRYLRASEAYEAAKVKCQDAQQGFVNRMSKDEKLSDQYNELVNKMTEAMGKNDQATAQRYQDQAMAMQDPSCTVKQPSQPDDYYEAQRSIDSKAEQAGVKSSGLSASEYAMALERGEGILRNNPPPDASESEKNAVKDKASDLKPLMHIQDQPATRAMKPAPAPQPAPAPAPQPAPAVNQAQYDMASCMAANAQKHEKEIQALGERAKAAQQAGDMSKTMAIADSINRIQMAGCNQGQ